MKYLYDGFPSSGKSEGFCEAGRGLKGGGVMRFFVVPCTGDSSEMLPYTARCTL